MQSVAACDVPGVLDDARSTTRATFRSCCRRHRSRSSRTRSFTASSRQTVSRIDDDRVPSSPTRDSGPLLAGLHRASPGSPRRVPSRLDVNGQAGAALHLTTRGRRFLSGRRRRPSTPTRQRIVLHRFPLERLLALFTLVMWVLVWLGFGWVHRLEWLFTGRRRRRGVRDTRGRDDSRRGACRCLRVLALVLLAVDGSCASIRSTRESLGSFRAARVSVERRVDGALLHRAHQAPAPRSRHLLQHDRRRRELSVERRLEPRADLDRHDRDSRRTTPSRLPERRQFKVCRRAMTFGVACTASPAAASSARRSPARAATSGAVRLDGDTHWYAAGFDTLVGSSAYLSVYNPTATRGGLQRLTVSPRPASRHRRSSRGSRCRPTRR